MRYIDEVFSKRPMTISIDARPSRLPEEVLAQVSTDHHAMLWALEQGSEADQQDAFNDLIEALTELKEEHPQDWQLATGDKDPARAADGHLAYYLWLMTED